MSAALRGMVSKKKVRFQEDGFDLDLTYITPRLIAMGAPSEGSEGMYRNPMPEVQRFFETRHAGRYRIYDLRAERGAAYDTAKFGGRVVGYRFWDHNPAPLRVIRECCEDIHRWLAADPGNVAAIHCKAGKGRTGLIVAAYLVYSGISPSTAAALRFFGDIRTYNGKGVTIPSQMRYVHYFEQLLRSQQVARASALEAGAGEEAAAAAAAAATSQFAPGVYRLRHIRLHTVPNFDVGGGCDPYFDVRLGDGRHLVFDWLKAQGGKVKNYQPKAKVVDLDLSGFNVRVKGDVKVMFYDWDRYSAPDKMFHFWFNTGYISNNYLLLHKEVLDRACKDKACKEFDHDFKVEVFLDRVEEVPGEFDDALAAEHLDDGGDEEDMDDDDAE